MNQLINRALTFLKIGDASRLKNQIASRLKRKPLLASAYVLAMYLKDRAKVPPPTVAVHIKELTETDAEEIEEVAGFGFYGRSKADILQYLADGQRCWIAKCSSRTVACYWMQSRGFYDPYLKRRIELANSEEYHLGAFTVPEFRGKGILPYLHSHTSIVRSQADPNLRVLVIIRTNNTASLQVTRKEGYAIVGHIGFIEVLGIRFHYLWGSGAFPKISQRFFFRIFG